MVQAKRKKLWLKAEMEVRRALSEGRHLQQQQPGGADKAQKLLLKQSLVVLRILFSESSYPLSKFLGELQQLVTLAQEGIVPELSKWFLLLEQVLSVIGTPGSFAGLAQVNNFVGSEAYQKPSYYQKVAVENEESDHLSSLNRGDDTAKKTVWVGDIPEDIADSPQALSEALRVFGKVLSLTVRKKPGDCKSWALATFVEVHAARTATSRARLVFKDGGGQPVKVQIRTSKVDQELNKEGTGALAATWASQEQKLEAAEDAFEASDDLIKTELRRMDKDWPTLLGDQVAAMAHIQTRFLTVAAGGDAPQPAAARGGRDRAAAYRRPRHGISSPRATIRIVAVGPSPWRRVAHLDASGASAGGPRASLGTAVSPPYGVPIAHRPRPSHHTGPSAGLRGSAPGCGRGGGATARAASGEDTRRSDWNAADGVGHLRAH